MLNYRRAWKMFCSPAFLENNDRRISGSRGYLSTTKVKHSRMSKTEYGRMELNIKYEKHIIIPQEQGNHN